jgi:outer membrane receptor protein involved in Fe transport
VEAGLSVEGEQVSGFAGYSLQAATSRSGANTGKHLKAIPRHSLNAGLSLRPLRRLEAGLFVTRAGRSYLDDANSVTLPAFVRLDGRLVLRAGGLQLSLEGRNLLGARYSSTGFLDPAGSGEAYLYPAAGRTLELGVGSAW